jgi:SHS2 domain-containing protein
MDVETSPAHWEHFDHGADIGVRGIAPTLAGAFEQAALAMTAAMVDPETVEAKERIELQCRAPDPELLLVDWLNALVYEMAIRKMLFSRFSVEIRGDRLRASAWGEPIDVARHEPAVEIKGATYTALRVHQNDDGDWVAGTVIDV